MKKRLPPPGKRAIGGVIVAKPAPPPPQDGQPGADATIEQIAEAVAAYLRANPPRDGLPGKEGAPGAAARPITAEDIAVAVAAWFEAHPIAPAKRGPRGERGPAPDGEFLQQLIRAIVVELKDELRGPRGFGSSGPPGIQGPPGPKGDQGDSGGGSGSGGVPTIMLEDEEFEIPARRQEVFVDDIVFDAGSSVTFNEASSLTQVVS